MKESIVKALSSEVATLVKQKDFLKEKKHVLDSITEITLNELLSEILDSVTISWQIIKPQKDE